nr:FecR domain-containing protein [Candidatus Gracilibacteria bacterium]
MKQSNKNAFSLIELLVVITILVILGSVWISMNSSYKERTGNAKITADLNTIESTIRTYKQEIGNLPDPGGNLKYFTNNGGYAHDETESFGVDGSITEKTFPKRYINVTPLDPNTNQYYAYGKTIVGGSFEVAAVLSNNGEYESIVKSNYYGTESLYNLVREYNGPGFVYDKSKSRFPYDPNERILKAKINDFTGSLTLNDSITDKNILLSRDLVEGDKLSLPAGSIATIYISDGSIIYLGDSDSPTELTLANLMYPKNNNLFTRVNLALNFGSILVKASKLSTESSFDIYTSDTEASVRGTIFIVTKKLGSSNTIVTVIKGLVSINKLLVSGYSDLLNRLIGNMDIPKNPVTGLSPSTYENIIIDGKNEVGIKDGTSVEVSSELADGKNITYSIPDIFTPYLGNTIVESSKTPEILCGDGFHIDGTICVSNIQSSNCSNIPTNATYYNNDINYSIEQSWTGSTWEPSTDAIIAGYSDLPLVNTCQFKCNTGYENVGGNTCQPAPTLLNGNGCTQCPEGDYSKNTDDSCGLGKGNISAKYCYYVKSNEGKDVMCEIEHKTGGTFSKCNGRTKLNWSGTYTPSK